MKNKRKHDLSFRAAEIRRLMVDTILSTQSGHPGGSFSCVDILAALFFSVMNIDQTCPLWEDRDRFILSKGHASLAYYSTLAACGYFDKELMKTFRRDGSILSGHPDMRKIPGVDMSSGSLGQGLSVGVGMALAAKYDNKNYRTYVLIGDGEAQEGQVWEAALSAAQFKLDNLTVILDRNMLQIDGRTEDILKMEPLGAKWKDFGWEVRSVDGHDTALLVKVLKDSGKDKKPLLILANTTKGKGIKLMEDKCEWHGMKCKITDEDANNMIKDVGSENGY
jgi:transketolase